MIITPKVRGFLCTTTHPIGCQKNVENQIDYVKNQAKTHQNLPKFKRVLVIGGSTGYGLASRIVSTFGLGADTLNIALERPYSERSDEVKPASPGWYQTAHFEKLAKEAGHYAESIIGDAFTDETKQQAIEKIKQIGPIDLIVYSLASPRRTDPKDGTEYRSVLKAIGNKDTKKTFNATKDEITEVEVDIATEEEINATIKVMGGEDWKLWIEALKKEKLLAPGFVTLAYSYIGPDVTQAIYRQGTIGRAKVHLEQTAAEITAETSDLGGKAYISVNKGLVTQAASAIPVLPLYLSLLYRVMKDKNIHEGCIEQISRLFMGKMKVNETLKVEVEVDEQNFIRLDDWEMKPEIQKEVAERMKKIDNSNIQELSDVTGYQKDFLQMFGFELDEIDYQADVPPEQIKVDL